ncbi:MAG TPA: two-component sensor histidine kinase [Clostridiales bacterium UBA8960]|nr:two-component sensor histidine kinase [Clostridiales bacterium UBA8960]
MFKKLRRRLLIINLSMISILMVLSFSTIYFMTYQNIENSIKQELFRVSSFKTNTRLSIPRLDTTPRSEVPKDGIERNFPEERTIAFLIETNKNYQIISLVSYFTVDMTFYQTAIETALNQKSDSGKIAFDDYDWAYMIEEKPFGYSFAFVDISTEQAVLDRLILTFLIVTLVMFAIIVLISNFLTGQSIKPIREAFDKQKQFISDASHELKTPLSVIQTNVEVLLSNGHSKWLTYIKDEVVRMGHLTNDLLYLAKIDYAEEHQIIKAEFDFSKRIEHLILGLEAVIFEKKIEFTYNILPSVRLHGNPEQLSQVLMILLDNAIKYTPEGGSMALDMVYTTHQFVLSVSNTGEGISPEDLPHIFDRFYRGDKSRARNSDSYGLGLSIAKSIIEQHGGKINCESTHGQTTFTIKLKK